MKLGIDGRHDKFIVLHKKKHINELQDKKKHKQTSQLFRGNLLLYSTQLGSYPAWFGY